MEKLVNWISTANIFLYSVTICLIKYTINGIISLVTILLGIEDIHFHERLQGKNFQITLGLIFDTTFLTPIIETLVFQTLFFYAYKKFNIHKNIIILASGTFFGLIHNYSIFYMLIATIMGFIFMYFYILRDEKNAKPFLSTIIAHSVINISVTIMILISRYEIF